MADILVSGSFVERGRTREELPINALNGAMLMQTDTELVFQLGPGQNYSHIGNQFRINEDNYYKQCVCFWLEKTDVPYLGSMQINTWFDMHTQLETAMFNNDRFIDDYPAATYGTTRTLDFAIGIQSSPEEDEEGNWKYLYISAQQRVVNNQSTFSIFDAVRIRSPAGVFGGLFYELNSTKDNAPTTGNLRANGIDILEYIPIVYNTETVWRIE